MIAYVLCGLLLLSLFVHFAQYRITARRNAGLRYINEKLNGIQSEKTNERLLLVTADPELRDMLIGINRFLAFNHESAADSARIKQSMRKMLTNVAHDLRTPLAVVIGYIETIQYNRNLSDEEKDELLAKAKSKAVEVSALMGRLFDLAKLESGDWPLERRNVHLNEVCRNTVLGYYDVWTDKGLEVSIDIPEAPIYVKVDEEALRRILDNLISNAVRYGAEGNAIGMTVRQDEDHAYIEVWDRGRGIGETERERIFERLYMLDDSRSAAAVGSGLGLTIAKRLTEQMDGRIQVDSKPYERTTFTVRFPKLNVRLPLSESK
ncbi:sensor histidine kinase [Cohnella caldifontis]|uniref:sensor histidine kinase n=1 Tax=Cohnella caldifontis TaxID=3027471 RepID=UPI0023EC0C9A|nr:sensor histidine kinase [Cohnella sp. YIM B05605]